MPITSNAKNPTDRGSMKALINAVPEAVQKRDVVVTFDKEGVLIDDGDTATGMTRASFNAWKKAGFPYRNGEPNFNGEPEEQREEIRPQPKPVSKQRARRVTGKAKAKATKGEPAIPQPAKSRESKEAPAEEHGSIFDSFAAEAFEIDRTEKTSESGRNVARFTRGEMISRLTSMCKASRIPVKKALEELNIRATIVADQHSVPDFTPITETEATMSRSVVEAFGSGSTFQLVNTINPVTGKPLVRDNGEPFEVPITEVTINKLYPLVEFVGAKGYDYDELASFAHNNSEKVVKKTKSVAKKLSVPFSKVMREITSLTEKRISPLDSSLGEVEVQAPEAMVMEHLKRLQGDPVESEVVSIKTVRTWYESYWEPLRALMSHLGRLYFPESVSQNSGEVSAVFVLERTIGQFFNVTDDKGIHRTLAALVEAGDMTENQANTFIDSHALNPETGDWVQVEAAEQAVTAVSDDDDIFGDEDADIDDPPFEDDAEEDAGDDEFDD